MKKLAKETLFEIFDLIDSMKDENPSKIIKTIKEQFNISDSTARRIFKLSYKSYKQAFDEWYKEKIKKSQDDEKNENSNNQEELEIIENAEKILKNGIEKIKNTFDLIVNQFDEKLEKILEQKIERILEQKIEKILNSQG